MTGEEGGGSRGMKMIIRNTERKKSVEPNKKSCRKWIFWNTHHSGEGLNRMNRSGL